MSAVATRVRDLSKQLSATRDTHLARDAALLAARIGLTWIFIYHGARTLFGSFGGPGITKAAVFYSTVAHLHPGEFFAVVSGAAELVGAVAVGLGIFGRLGAAAIAGDMIMASATVTFHNGIASNAAGGGYELTLGLAALAIVVACLGTGSFSLDVLLRRYTDRRSAGAGRLRRSD